MIDESGIFLLKVDLVAAGTKLRVGSGAAEFRLVEHLSLGDEIYDPIQEKLIEITEMACVTLDFETIRDRGFSPKKLGETAEALIYAVKVPKTLARTGYTPPIRGEHQLTESLVFFALGFERKATVETPTTYCEFVRPSLYAIENIAGRAKPPTREDSLTIRGQ
jgi:hypothetical protein